MLLLCLIEQKNSLVIGNFSFRHKHTTGDLLRLGIRITLIYVIIFSYLYPLAIFVCIPRKQAYSLVAKAADMDKDFHSHYHNGSKLQLTKNVI